MLCCSYAYLECANEKIAYEMSEKYKDAEVNGVKLYVIQAISEKKDKFGEKCYYMCYLDHDSLICDRYVILLLSCIVVC